MKRNDAQAQQAVDHQQAASKLALRVLTAAETRTVAAAARHTTEPEILVIKSTAK